MVNRRHRNTLKKWEVSIVKAMIATGNYNDQDIQSYFTRPTRTINHARIKEIRDGDRHRTVPVASEENLAQFLTSWPDRDLDTGLDARCDELLIKAREAMIAVAA